MARLVDGNAHDTIEQFLDWPISVRDKFYFIRHYTELSLKERQSLTLVCAKVSVEIYEKKYPKDRRVRDCVEAIELFNNGSITKDELMDKRAAAAAAADAAYAYAYAAAAAADAAAAAAAYAYAAAAAYAYDAADAADADAYAAAAAYAAADAAYAYDAADAADADAYAAAYAYAAADAAYGTSHTQRLLYAVKQWCSEQVDCSELAKTKEG